jgi:hypothetical protein
MGNTRRHAEIEWRNTIHQNPTPSYSRATQVARKKPLAINTILAYLKG